MANGNFREYLQANSVRIKKYFYVLRPILAMQWIEKNDSAVPMEFEVLVNQLIVDDKLKAAIKKLLKDKQKTFESDYLPRVEVISQFIETELARFKNKTQEYKKTETDFSQLNLFFIDVLNGVYSS